MRGAAVERAGVLGIMGALDAEVRLIRDDLVGAEELFGPCPMVRGHLDGHEVVVARCGMGKVNAALAACALAGAGVDAIVFTGVAGAVAPGLGIGDVVVGESFVQHDADDTAFGSAIGQVPGEPARWRGDPDLTAAVLAAAQDSSAGHRVVSGTIASGDQFIADPAKVSWLRETFGADAVEMEGAALAQAATHLSVPFAVARILSDSADGGAARDFPAFLERAARRDRDLIGHLLCTWG